MASPSAVAERACTERRTRLPKVSRSTRLTIGNSLPPQLTGLGGLGIKLVSFDYDFSATELQSFNIEITTSPASPWTLFGPVQLTAFDVLFQVMDPVGERLAVEKIDEIAVFTVANDFLDRRRSRSDDRATRCHRLQQRP